tara:strand:+ start:77 stop:697 length:621 start_codon:yes stop_codon:yes gene_type:complete
MSGVVTQNVLGSSGLVKAVSAGGTWVEIKSLTASSSDDLSFVNGTSDVVLDDTYSVYCFHLISLHPSNDSSILKMNGSADAGSNYNVSKVNTYFESSHNQEDTSSGISYAAGHDESTTSAINLQSEYGTDNDQNGVGYLYLFGPGSTTFHKHWLFRGQQYHQAGHSQENYSGGYFNTASAVDAIQFTLSAGTIDAGKIKLFGIKDS